MSPDLLHPLADEAWIVGFSLIVVTAVFTFGPTPRIWHKRIIALRAALMMIGEMWEGAMARRSRWPELLERAKYDV